MKTIRIAAAVAALAALAPAQICLTTLFATNNGGSVGGAVYFDITLTAAVNIVSLETNYFSNGTPVGIDVWMTAAGGTYAGNEGNAAAWTLMGTDDGNAVSAGVDVPTVINLAAPISVAPGTYGVALVASGDGHRYTNGDGTNQSFTDGTLTIDLGTASNVPFTTPIFNPRVWNGTICYVPSAGFATATPYGTGCGGDNDPSAYETFTAGFDLSGTSHQYLFNGSTFAIVQAGGGIIAPVGTPLSIGDDQVIQVTLPFSMQRPGGTITDVFVDSNGRVGLESISSDFTETVGELLSGGSTICPLWDDLNPSAAGAGTVHAEVDPTDPNVFHITWTGVPEFPAVGANDFQVSLSAAGDIKVTYGTCSVADCLVGYSPGNGSSGTAIDFSADLPFILGNGTPDMTLANVQRPVIGATAVSETRDIPAGAIAGVHVIGFAEINPPIDFAIIGAGGCFWYAAADVTLNFTPAGATETHSLAIPNDPSLAGGNLFIQSVAIVPGANAGNLISTNGIRYTLDVN